MRNQYERPTFEIFKFDEEDCIRASFLDETKDNVAKDETFNDGFEW